MLTIVEYGVSGLDFSVRASGLPLSTDLEKTLLMENEEDYNKAVKRAKNLAKAKVGSGHDCFLKGITVNVILTATVPFWGQFERYAFQDTISSTSQMHKLTEQELDGAFDEDTPQEQIDILRERIDAYNADKTEKNYRKVIMAVPSGYLYTRAIQTNYLQLKTMYRQRKDHKLKEWEEFREWMLTLPMFDEFVNQED